MSTPLPPMTSNRPYLIRALHEWISDNGLTPYLLVDAVRAEVNVPPHLVSDGRIVLNIAHRAVAGLELGDEYISFSARFSGVSRNILVPISAVLAIYCHENGHGMAMPVDAEDEGDAAQTPQGSHLSAVSAESEDTPSQQERRPSGLRSVPNEPTPKTTPNQAETEGDSGSDDEPPPKGGHPTLRVVK